MNSAYLHQIVRASLRAGLGLAIAASVALGVRPSHVAAASTAEIAVDTTLDSNSVQYQACTPAPSDCSLRGAISKANGCGNIT